jgi:hypothetical protein
MIPAIALIAETQNEILQKSSLAFKRVSGREVVAIFSLAASSP